MRAWTDPGVSWNCHQYGNDTKATLNVLFHGFNIDCPFVFPMCLTWGIVIDVKSIIACGNCTEHLCCIRYSNPLSIWVWHRNRVIYDYQSQYTSHIWVCTTDLISFLYLNEVVRFTSSVEGRYLTDGHFDHCRGHISCSCFSYMLWIDHLWYDPIIMSTVLPPLTISSWQRYLLWKCIWSDTFYPYLWFTPWWLRSILLRAFPNHEE